MPVHKCQGQTMDFVGIDCSVLFFAHRDGQTYVAASRVKTRDSIAFYHPAAMHHDVSCLNDHPVPVWCSHAM
eukprot:2740973-Rhodomonas_salina.1